MQDDHKRNPQLTFTLNKNYQIAQKKYECISRRQKKKTKTLQKLIRTHIGGQRVSQQNL